MKHASDVVAMLTKIARSRARLEDTFKAIERSTTFRELARTTVAMAVAGVRFELTMRAAERLAKKWNVELPRAQVRK